MTQDKIDKLTAALRKARAVVEDERDTVLATDSDLNDDGEPIPGTASYLTLAYIAEMDALLAEIDEALALEANDVC